MVPQEEFDPQVHPERVLHKGCVGALGDDEELRFHIMAVRTDPDARWVRGKLGGAVATVVPENHPAPVSKEAPEIHPIAARAENVARRRSHRHGGKHCGFHPAPGLHNEIHEKGCTPFGKAVTVTVQLRVVSSGRGAAPVPQASRCSGLRLPRPLRSRPVAPSALGDRGSLLQPIATID